MTPTSCAPPSAARCTTRPCVRTSCCWCATGRSPTSWIAASRSCAPTARCRCSVVPIERSTGLGPALDAGLAASPFDIVARMDSDDIAVPTRFEVQLPLIRGGADIVGAGLLEFESDPSAPGRRRVPPTDPGRHPPLRAHPRPVQPPDGRVPPQRGAGRRRLRRPPAHGGLLVVLADARRGRPAPRTCPTRWSTTASGPGPTSAGAAVTSCVRSSRCSGGCATPASSPGPVRAQRHRARGVPTAAVAVAAYSLPLDRGRLRRTPYPHASVRHPRTPVGRPCSPGAAQ